MAALILLLARGWFSAIRQSVTRFGTEECQVWLVYRTAMALTNSVSNGHFGRNHRLTLSLVDTPEPSRGA